jgi:hypothetical protein
MPIEIAVGDLIEHAFPGVVVQHQTTEHSLFGLDGMRRHFQRGGLQIVLLGSGNFVHGHLESGLKTDARKTKGTTCKQDRARCYRRTRGCQPTSAA